MPVELKEQSGGRILEVRATGKLVACDYEDFAPVFEQLRTGIKQPKDFYAR